MGECRFGCWFGAPWLRISWTELGSDVWKMIDFSSIVAMLLCIATVVVECLVLFSKQDNGLSLVGEAEGIGT